VEPGRTGARLYGSNGFREFTVTRWHCMEFPGPETPHGLAPARAEDGSGEVSLRTANPLPSSDLLIRIGFSKGRIPHKQAHLRVNRGVVGLSGSAQGLALRVARVARGCGVGVSSQVVALARTYEPR
jgi:hypothetical protein